MSPSGVLIVNKEKGMTSFDVIFKLRKMLGIKKMGHTGTLDPDAEGVLPVCIGRATKVVDMLTGTTKTYRAVMRLGVETDTQDLSGTVLNEKPIDVTENEIRETVLSFQGEQWQIPPMYSAVKINGKKLVDLARRGVEVERTARPVTFENIEIEAIELPDVTFSVTCSKGAYIRTLCHDIGQKLGCGAAMASLTRTRVGQFELKDAMTLDEIRAAVSKSDPDEPGEHASETEIGRLLIPIDELFPEAPRLTSRSVNQDRYLLNGNAYKGESDLEDGTRVRVYLTDGSFVGLYRYKKDDKRFKLEKFFYDLSE